MSGGAPTETPRASVSDECPGVGAVRVHPDGQIVHHPDRHPGLQRGALSAGELLVEAPLQPLVEADPVGQLVTQRLHTDRRRVAHLVRPRRRGQPEMLGECAPRGEVAQALALAVAEDVESQLP